jgi:hypothetical protein
MSEMSAADEFVFIEMASDSCAMSLLTGWN